MLLPMTDDSSYVPLSKSDEKLSAEKNITGDPPAAGLYAPWSVIIPNGELNVYKCLSTLNM